MKDKICKIKQHPNFILNCTDDKYTKHSINLVEILKSAQNFLENLYTKQDTSKTNISKVLNKNPKRMKNLKQQYDLIEAKIFVEKVTKSVGPQIDNKSSAIDSLNAKFHTSEIQNSFGLRI